MISIPTNAWQTRIIGFHFAADSMDLRWIFWWAPYFLFLQEWRFICFIRSRSSKVTDFGANRKRVCDFLVIRHSNLGPILHRFRDIAGFCAPDPPLFHPNFGVFPLHQVADVGIDVNRYFKLFGREIIVQVFHLFDKGTWTLQTVWDRRTDRETDKRTDCGIIVCVALRGSKKLSCYCNSRSYCVRRTVYWQTTVSVSVTSLWTARTHDPIQRVEFMNAPNNMSSNRG